MPLIALLYISCSDENTVRMSDRKVHFLRDKISVDPTGGNVIALIEWNYTTWKLETTESGNIVKSFSISRGGEVDKCGF